MRSTYFFGSEDTYVAVKALVPQTLQERRTESGYDTGRYSSLQVGASDRCIRRQAIRERMLQNPPHPCPHNGASLVTVLHAPVPVSC